MVREFTENWALVKPFPRSTLACYFEISAIKRHCLNSLIKLIFSDGMSSLNLNLRYPWGILLKSSVLARIYYLLKSSVSC
jgi:hypothetical protein